MESLGSIVLAAGRARRFGGDKLLQPLAGVPLILHAVRAACAAPVTLVAIVHRPDATLEAVCEAAAAEDARIVSLTNDNEAMSDSLRVGTNYVAHAAGAFVFLADMPLIPEAVPNQMAPLLSDRFAVVPTFRGRPGHPVLLSARAIGLLHRIVGDRGAGALVHAHAAEVAYVETGDERVVLDVDTRDDFTRIAAVGLSRCAEAP